MSTGVSLEYKLDLDGEWALELAPCAVPLSSPTTSMKFESLKSGDPLNVESVPIYLSTHSFHIMVFLVDYLQ